MATFNPKKQAQNIIGQYVSHTPKPRPEKRAGDRKIRAIGTRRDYTATATCIASWLKDRHATTLYRMTRSQALEYLEIRRHIISQKTLDRDRTVLDRMPRTGKTGLPRISSTVAPGRLSTGSRAYEHDQLDKIESRQRPRTALATAISRKAGLRAHELQTLKRYDELTDAEKKELWAHEKWDERVWKGRPGVWYSVVGKGGLRRIAIIPHDLSERLEARRLPPGGILKRDREIPYTQLYDISGGVQWSSAFSKASKRAFGWSTGAHSCRHTYIQDRYSAYRAAGYTHDEALAFTAQDVGHFRKEITLKYLR